MKDQSSTKSTSGSSAVNKPGHLRLTKQENAYFDQLFSTYAEPDRAKKDTVNYIMS